MGQNCSCQKDSEDLHNQIILNGKPGSYVNGRTDHTDNHLDENLPSSQKKIMSLSGVKYESVVQSEKRLQLADSQVSGIKDKSSSSRNVASYEGEMCENLPDGKGKEIYKNGDEYVGHFLRGKKNGFGVYYKPGQYRYTGNFRNNKMTGYGKIDYENGSSYSGEFENGLYNGKGTLVEKDKTEKKGVWKEGEFISQ